MLYGAIRASPPGAATWQTWHPGFCSAAVLVATTWPEVDFWARPAAPAAKMTHPDPLPSNPLTSYGPRSNYRKQVMGGTRLQIRDIMGYQKMGGVKTGTIQLNPSIQFHSVLRVC